MSEITIKIEATDLINALNALAAALNSNTCNSTVQPGEPKPDITATVQSVPTPVAPISAPAVPMGCVPTQQIPTTTHPMPAMQVPTSPVPNAATAPASPSVPTTATTAVPSYTIEQFQTAIAPLLDAGKVEQIQQLVQSFGVATLMDIPKERYGEFANGLRNIGGVI